MFGCLDGYYFSHRCPILSTLYPATAFESSQPIYTKWTRLVVLYARLLISYRYSSIDFHLSILAPYLPPPTPSPIVSSPIFFLALRAPIPRIFACSVLRVWAGALWGHCSLFASISLLSSKKMVDNITWIYEVTVSLKSTEKWSNYYEAVALQILNYPSGASHIIFSRERHKPHYWAQWE